MAPRAYRPPLRRRRAVSDRIPLVLRQPPPRPPHARTPRVPRANPRAVRRWRLRRARKDPLPLARERIGTPSSKADLQRGEGRTPRRDARIMRGIDLVEIGLVGEILDVDAERDRLVDLVRGAGVEADIAGHRSDQRLGRRDDRHVARSEEHTSELQSLMRISYAV